VGTAAMLWVGGHIILVGLDELGWHAPYEAVHHAETFVHEAAAGPLGAALAWLTNTFFSAVLGVVWGAVLVLVWELLPFGKTGHGTDDDGAHEAHGQHSPAAPGAGDGTTTPGDPTPPAEGGSTATR
jgi:hypothetical protein